MWIHFIIGGLGKLSFGRFSEIMPFRYVVTLCFALQALAAFVLVNLDSMAMLWLYVAIFGFGMGGVAYIVAISGIFLAGKPKPDDGRKA